MPYSKQTWIDLPVTTTPLDAARLNHIEDGLEEVAALVDAIEAITGGPSSTIYFFNGVPDISTGHIDDVGINKLTGDVYQKGASVWGSPIGNWTGPIGEPNTLTVNSVTTSAPGSSAAFTISGTSPNQIIDITLPRGSAGPAGSVWYHGTGVPSGGVGANGDFYLNDANGDVYTKVTGSWGAPVTNIKGGSGAAGSVWYTGSGAPSGGTGVNGDYYYNTANGDVYNKTGGSWGSPVSNIKGANGTNGALWYNGSGAPSGGTGANGDYYYNTANGDVYTKSGGSWGSPVGNIKGAAGANGAVWYSGSGVPGGGTGANGDYYLNTANGDVYTKVSGSWGSSVANIKGTAGTNGSNVLLTSGVPGGGTGANGDYAIDILTGNTYGPKAAGAWGSSTGNVIPSIIVLNTDASTTYTLVLTDAGTCREFTSNSAITITIPLNSSVAFPVGTEIQVRQIGTGQITVNGAGGVTRQVVSSATSRTQNSTLVLTKRATDTWLVSGDAT